MNRLFSAKSLLVAAVALGAVGAASAAHARTDVVLSVGFPAAYVQPAPVYVQPEPVYVQPRVAYYDNYRYVERRGEWRGWRAANRHGAWGDADRDGVPNRYDRAPYNPYRR